MELAGVCVNNPGHLSSATGVLVIKLQKIVSIKITFF
jgi:hypothetical protein